LIVVEAPGCRGGSDAAEPARAGFGGSAGTGNPTWSRAGRFLDCVPGVPATARLDLLIGRPPVVGATVSTMPVRPLEQLLEAGWADALRPVATEIAAMGEFLRAELAAGRSYLPAGANVLRAFSQPLDDVRVLIVGQDPYPTPGHPVGLAFSVAPDVRPVPRSLQNIYRELHDDLGLPIPSNGDLSPWTSQGVLLLNRVLTVRPGKPGSHAGKGWERVTDQAVRALAARDLPLVAILWGRQAQSLEPLLTDVDCVKSVHPSPLSASGGFFGSRPFSRVNALLVEHGGDPVDWRLT
jgi:uracil-DNA glycosylase